MNSSKKLEEILKQLIKVLENEKQILVKNDAVSLALIVERKNELINKMQEFKGMGFSEDEKIIKLVSTIDSLQETNLLLTKQAMSFQDQLLKALAINNTSKYNTYSSKGCLYNQSEVGIVDQSV
jgi:flagellar biosynthesis/type III secretory pathway chaperone